MCVYVCEKEGEFGFVFLKKKFNSKRPKKKNLIIMNFGFFGSFLSYIVGCKNV